VDGSKCIKMPKELSYCMPQYDLNLPINEEMIAHPHYHLTSKSLENGITWVSPSSK